MSEFWKWFIACAIGYIWGSIVTLLLMLTSLRKR